MNHCIFSGQIANKEVPGEFESKDGRRFSSLNFQLEVSNQRENILIPCRYICPADEENNLMNLLVQVEKGQEVILFGKLNLRIVNFGLTTITEPSIFIRSIELVQSKYDVIDEDDDYMLVNKIETPF